jgi:hypothetical protein
MSTNLPKIGIIGTILLLSLVTVTFKSTASQIALPSPPAGYSWKESNEVTFAILCPDDWYFKQAIQDNTIGLFISKENNESNGFYETGIFVYIKRNVKTETGIEPSEFIKAYHLESAKKSEIIDQWNKNVGPLTNISYKSITYYEDERPLKQHTILVANDSTGTVYIINFETLPELWIDNWKIVEPILQKIYIDSSV